MARAPLGMHKERREVLNTVRHTASRHTLSDRGS